MPALRQSGASSVIEEYGGRCWLAQAANINTTNAAIDRDTTASPAVWPLGPGCQKRLHGV
jgi:hypothetical protein